MNRKARSWASLHGMGTAILVGAALYFVVVEHSGHVLRYLPFLIILLCPLMHLFMHKGHGGHDTQVVQDHDTDAAYRRGLEEGRKESAAH